jgi:hypothetical protein
LAITYPRFTPTARAFTPFPKALKSLEHTMREIWRAIDGFPDYSISTLGNVRSDKSGRILSLFENQSGLLMVGVMRDGTQWHRSVPLLVARACLAQPTKPFDTPINLDGDRRNNRVDNLAWRPRWFAVRYNRQFIHRYANPINKPIQEVKTKEVCENSFECAKKYGLLEEDLVLSILNRTYVWPTYQEFRALED